MDPRPPEHPRPRRADRAGKIERWSRPDVAATRAAYDTVAEDYAELLRSSLADSPHERAALGLFAELVGAAGGGLVGDLGCGTGRLTGHLVGLGLDVVSLDLSPGMVAVARREHPDVPARRRLARRPARSRRAAWPTRWPGTR